MTETPEKTSNPYEAPQKFVRDAMKTEKLLMKGFVAVGFSALIFGFLGGVTGLCIGVVLPDYYRSMFRGVDFRTIDEWRLGMGLGITQGLVAGVVIGCVTLLATAWYKSRMNSSMIQMMAQIQALQSTSPNVDVEEDIDLSQLTKTRSNE